MNPMKPKLLIVDDDDEIRTQMKWALGQDYEILLAGDRASALTAFRSARPMVVLLDLGLPPSPGSPEEGLKALADLLAVDGLTKVIVITGQGEKPVALQAVGAGAYYFQCKPVEMDELQLMLARCFHIAQLEREYREIQQGLSKTAFEGILGANARMQAVFGAIRKVAQSDASVLILGESGTGKEMVARAIHNRSAAKDGPFVAINCSAIPETLMESELFGHEKGSFTGAHTQRKGRIESAEGGTLFLDEVGDIPLLLQVKLLRFLQEQRIERVGGRQEIVVKTRVIAATNIDLTKAMSEGTFREDLFYRLAVVQINLPPLRDREEDVLLLAQSFLQTFAAQCGKAGLTFSPQATHAIQHHAWPGNVRELQNRVRRAIIMSGGKRLSAQDLELGPGAAGQPGATLKDAREAVEREMLQHALRKHNGNISSAAAELDISRPTFYELMEKLGVKRPE
jgi:two-component system NtrC family response regulator